MRNKKAIIGAALIAPALALTGGLAYASTTSGPATATQPTVTTTAQPGGQHPTGQPRHDRCDWRCGDHHNDGRGHGYQPQSSPRWLPL